MLFIPFHFIIRFMKFLIQRVTGADVKVAGKSVGSIGCGFLVFIGVCAEDTRAEADKLIRKMLGLRIFQDENGKTNLSLDAVGGGLLLVSQFTLYADCRKGNRPSFIRTGSSEHARDLYEYIISSCRAQKPQMKIEAGVFGADMKIELLNDGPFTIILDSGEL